MATPTVSVRGIVVGKVKLGESDLIVRLLAEDGSLVEVVAKGARRPQGSLSGKMDLFNEVSVLMSAGKGLGIVKECRLLLRGPGSVGDPVMTSAAACMSEFAAKTSQVGLVVERYFDLLRVALGSLAGASSAACVAVSAAYLLKGASILGARPHLRSCVVCDEAVLDATVEHRVVAGADSMGALGEVDAQGSRGLLARTTAPSAPLLLSYAEGGLVCPVCSQDTHPEPEAVSAQLVSWADWLIGSPFSDVRTAPMGPLAASDALMLACRWAEGAFGVRLRSASMLAAFAAS